MSCAHATTAIAPRMYLGCVCQLI